jgi:hypothetical protein
MSIRRTRVGFAAAALCCLLTGPAAAASIAITSLTGNDPYTFPGTVGYSFALAANVEVTSLGLWDSLANGFIAPHEVGIFETDGTLLTSAIVDSSDTLIDGFRYQAISPFSLSAGTYVIGAFMENDHVLAGGSVTTDPLVTHLLNLHTAGTGLVMPDEHHPFYVQGFFGPNFQFDDVQAPAVPEPATLALMAAGLATCAYRRAGSRRRASRRGDVH